MASPFLRSVADHIHTHYKDNVERLCIVLPNRRGALFLKNHLAQAFGKTIWLPAIISSEDLITQLSGLKVPEEIDLICHLYESYRACYGDKAENFESFAKWGQLILQDFNEIDRYLADPEQLYENLKDIKEIENWSLGAEQLTEHQKDYLQFMSSLGAIYKHLRHFLLSQGLAWQGLAYREAAAKTPDNTFTEAFDRVLFCGFNALNAAELKIIRHLKQSGKAELLWDADHYYLDDPNQEAGHFLRKNFGFFDIAQPQFIQEGYKQPKDIHIVSVPGQTGQAQVVKQELQRLLDENVPPDRIAVVLANEKLLWPVLQQLPAGIQHVNITMEYPLRYTSAFSLIDGFIQLQLNFANQKKTHKTIYHKDLVALLRQPLFGVWLRTLNGKTDLNAVVARISQNNISFVSAAALQDLFGEDLEKLRPLLQPVSDVTTLTHHLKELLQTLIDQFSVQTQNNSGRLELEYLEILLKNVNRLSEILTRYPWFSELSSFRQLFSQIVGNSSAPFIGEPLRGLQIMGVLETRTLDFDHLLLVNVNEGILPSGKSINSFIPNDLKSAFGLPLYLEKDAVYAYHFYRLLQRASEVVITCDSETDTFGKGEKSRFVTQLQLELRNYNPEIRITERIASYTSVPEALSPVIRMEKTGELLSAIINKAGDIGEFGGLSPSGLAMYKECPLRFYFRYGAGLKETKEVEESAEANTFGSILHLSLEQLYSDLVGRVVTPEDLRAKRTEIAPVVNAAFLKFFNNTAPAGKSLLQEEVIRVYVRKLLDADLKLLETLAAQNKTLTLQGLEQELTAPLQVEIEGQNSTVYIRGKIDRIDHFDRQLRIVDYKSSVKESDRFVFNGFEELFHNKDYNKQLQLFIYTWLFYKSQSYIPQELAPCIIPFKNFSEKALYITTENKQRLVFSSELLSEFEEALRGFVSEIFDRSKDFTQTEARDAHKYCPYNVICNFAV